MIQRTTTEILIEPENQEVYFVFEENGERCAEVYWLDEAMKGTAYHCTARGLIEEKVKEKLRKPTTEEMFFVRRLENMYKAFLKEAPGDGTL